MRKSWADLEAERQALHRHSPHFSRAELARRAGISESGFTKGLAEHRHPQKSVREKVELVLAAERAAIEGGLR